MSETTTVVCLPGDGIGPEITAAMKRIVAATGAAIDWLDMPAGYGSLERHGQALPQETVEAIGQHRLAIKGPTRTPKGEGHDSINVKLRKLFDLHVGFRPYRALPFPAGSGVRHDVDVVLFRQNTEGLYACVEQRTDGPNGPEVWLNARFTARAMVRLAQAAFTFASSRGRRQVTLVTKSNIHKVWGALYRDAFQSVAVNYPAIRHEEMLVDANSMKLVMYPRDLDVIVTENMFGDILSDLCAGLVGGLGVCPGANLGDDCAIFEAVHGTADDIAGQGKANPTALVLSAAMLLERIGLESQARHLRRAVSDTIRSGRVTGDLAHFYPSGQAQVLSTDAYTQAIISCLQLSTDFE